MPKPRALRLPLSQASTSDKPLPEGLRQTGSRGAGDTPLALVDNVVVTESWPLAPVSRSGDAPATAEAAADSTLMALEAADGTTVFMRADVLAERIAQLRPDLVDEDGHIDFARFREVGVGSRGAGEWLWKRISSLDIKPDAILDAAKNKATDWLGEKIGGNLQDKAVYAASTLGAKALMEAIEERLADEPGLYHWRGGALTAADRCRENDSRLADWGDAPALVFIHGTGSHTLGSFGALPGDDDWNTLSRRYNARIFGFEHRTFSEGPIDNALALAKVLPIGARLHVVTHSRGGLVGDLLCLGSGNAQYLDKLLSQYRRQPDSDADTTGERAKLRELIALVEQKKLRVERYVRVACPAAGTSLVSDNLDLFLSALLDLVRRGSGWAVGAAAGAVAGAFSAGAAGPVAAKLARESVDRGLKLLARVVLEIADKRIDPTLVPGIEAMLPQAPLGAFLARAPRQTQVSMAVIAGDIEGSGILKRIGVLFTDWMFFDRADNDLVVDTQSMYSGIAHHGAHAVFDHGAEVNHFAYFRNRRTRLAMRTWLEADDPSKLTDWTPMESLLAARAAASRSGGTPPADNTRPVVFIVPGIMGSHLEANRASADKAGSGNRIWLDPIELPGGAIAKIGMDVKNIDADDLLDMAYGKLARHLENSHRVIRFAYDWRQSVLTLGDKLAEEITKALQVHPDQPIRMLAHSMGGLISRAMIARHPRLWDEIAARDGGRLVMLGTPNHGAHSMVESLLGRSRMVRMLARVDFTNSLQEVLDIIGAFPGALQLLPSPGFVDTGGHTPITDYFKTPDWTALGKLNNDRWFGDAIVARLEQADLNTARSLWTALSRNDGGAAKPIAHPTRVSYVYGQADNTPCGLVILKDSKGDDHGLAMLGTPFGDGTVTWASGRLDDVLHEDQYWLMPANHSGLVNTPDYFDDIESLLEEGRARKLGRLPATRAGQAAPPVEYQPGPMPGYPSERELVETLVGGQMQHWQPPAKTRIMDVMVRAGDLSKLHVPVMCGHYPGDPIAGAEATLDRIVKRALSHRERLGIYAAELGTVSMVFMPRAAEDRLRNTRRGALVVGLGEFGELTATHVRTAVRSGVLHLLLYAADQYNAKKNAADLSVRLASVLIGYNSTTHISVEESVAAVTLGVLDANQQFAATSRDDRPAQVTALEFVELYEDVAITAARAVASLPQQGSRALRGTSIQLNVARSLEYGEGVRRRLSVAAGAGYWPRLIVTNADADENACPPECYTMRNTSPIPAEALDAVLQMHGVEKSRPRTPPKRPLPERFRFLFLSQRARAEKVAHQTQPRLIEQFVNGATRDTRYTPETGIGHTLFHLLVPCDFKIAAKETSNLLIVLDNDTANLPWEMLEVDGQPLVLRTRVIRQLSSSRYRQRVDITRERSACVIANPATDGYYTHFGATGEAVPEADHLRDLTGAEDEGNAIKRVLESNKYEVVVAPGGTRAPDVVGKLFKKCYRILVICAHGMFDIVDRDGNARTGVVLSDGLLLTAAEVGQMDIVPDLVFLNCCHLGKTGSEAEAGWAPNKLAYSLSRALIEMGVRCVVAAGWEVDDAAATTFSTTFFTHMVADRMRFGDAIFKARKACFEQHPNLNTWGAYQAYGDPAFTLETGSESDTLQDSWVSLNEFVAWLEGLQHDAQSDTSSDAFAKLQTKLSQARATVPTDWCDRPGVIYALAELYGKYGEAGFDEARAAYERAIGADTRHGIVPIGAIEQLANLEARTAEKLATRKGPKKVKAANVEKALARVKRAIERLQHLVSITDSMDPDLKNIERGSLLGSALKRKAAILLEAEKPAWDNVRAALTAAAEAYGDCECAPTSKAFDPYPTINRLQILGVVGQTTIEGAPDAEALLRACQEGARRRFEKSFDFWDAVMPADAEVALLLYRQEETAADLMEDKAVELEQHYRQCKASATASQLDSIAVNLELLARFMKSKRVSENRQSQPSSTEALLNRLAGKLRQSANA